MPPPAEMLEGFDRNAADLAGDRDDLCSGAVEELINDILGFRNGEPTTARQTEDRLIESDCRGTQLLRLIQARSQFWTIVFLRDNRDDRGG